MDDRRLHALARQRGNVLSLSDARFLGMSRDALSAHARRHHWLRPAPGVVVLPGTEMDFLRAVLVVLRFTGESRVVVGQHASAYLCGIVTRPPATIDVLVPMDRYAPRVEALRLPVTESGRTMAVTAAVRRTRTLRRGHCTRVGAVPVTTPARTLLDLAAHTDVDHLRSLVIDARQRRIVTLAQLQAVHDRSPCYSGRPKVRRVLMDLDAESCDSRLEWNFRRDARRRGFTPYPHPFPYCCSDGVVIEVDVAFPGRWVAVECDGLSSRADRAQLATHHLRQNRAVADGWRPFLVDWTRLRSDPDRLFAELAALLASPSPRPPAAKADPRLVDPRFRGRRRR